MHGANNIKPAYYWLAAMRRDIALILRHEVLHQQGKGAIWRR